MASVSDHYRDHLGRIYSWMAGDAEAAMERNRAELQALGAAPRSTGLAVDLGAGPGLHAIPLAQLGFSVVAFDSCAALNDELRARAAGLPVRVVEGDLRRFRAHCAGGADIVLCMGDTLTHLDSIGDVVRLLDDAASALTPGGLFMATLRDYSRELAGDARFIPVRSDASRILTCFLEYARDALTVHDLLHERDGAGWRLEVSSYRKLRLDPQVVADRLERAGLRAERGTAAGGMVRIVARRP